MSTRKREVFEELIEEIRRSQSATERFDQAVAEALGLGRTDMRCLDVLHRLGTLSAGRLAHETGLTSGAMTAALDRLERKRYIHRVRDAQDRRRVLIEPYPDALAQAGRLYADHVAMSERLYHRYDRAQLELLLRFVRSGREFNERQATELELRTRSGHDERRAGVQERRADPRERPGTA